MHVNRRESGLTIGATLWTLSIMGVVTYMVMTIALAMDLRLRRQALAYEAAVIINALRAYQSDTAAALSSYTTAVEVGWPDAANPSPCEGALTELATQGYLMDRYQISSVSAAEPRVRWEASCADPQRFVLSLSSFGDVDICGATDLAGRCPDAGLAVLLAAVTGGEAIPDPAATGNRMIQWEIYRGAEHLALQRLGEELLWRDLRAGLNAGIQLPTTALDGVQFGRGGITNSPFALAQLMRGPHPRRGTPL